MAQKNANHDYITVMPVKCNYRNRHGGNESKEAKKEKLVLAAYLFS